MSKKNKSESPSYTLAPFVEWAHKTGRIFIFAFLAYTVIIPVVVSAVYNAWPSLPAILPGLGTILAMLGIQSIMEVGLYTPILGSSCYLTFITGNIMNLKIPCALNAQNVAGVETNTTAGDAIAMISTCVSSIVTIVILCLGLFLVIPLRPFLESPIATSASNYLLAALFGCLVVGFVAPAGGKTIMKNKLLVTIVPAVITMVLALMGVLTTSMGMVMILVGIPICILTGRILYKKGVVRMVDNPNYKKKEVAPSPENSEEKAENN